MSVLIKGIENPENCHECDALGISDIVGLECKEYIFEHRPKDCPLIELSNHGRLIDADALIKSLEVDPVECPGCPEPEYLGEFIELLRETPTIIEAEEE